MLKSYVDNTEHSLMLILQLYLIMLYLYQTAVNLNNFFINSYFKSAV